MSSTNIAVTIPRPGVDIVPLAGSSASQKYISAPTEAAFVAQFGAHLPSVQYIVSDDASIAIYELPPTISSPETPIQRVLIAHGVGTPALGMLPLAKALQSSAPNLHIVLYDQFGHGLSSTPLVPHVPALFHSEIIQILQHLKWASVHLLGFSFGGSTVTSFTALYPDLVQSLVVVAPAGLLRSMLFDEQGRKYMKGGEGVDEDEARDWILDYISGGPLVVSPDWRASFAKGEISGGPIQVWEREHHKGHIPSFVAIARDGGISDMHQVFKDMSQGSTRHLGVVGELDDFCTEQDLKSVGFEDVVVVPQVGHNLVREKVPEVASPIIEFWGSL
jgi:pimeloyl-ACP methyl ester carboxylesterase